MFIEHIKSNVKTKKCQETSAIAAELLKLVERAVLDYKKEGKPWLREGKFDWYIFKNGYINSGLLVMTNKTKKKILKNITGIWPIQGKPF